MIFYPLTILGLAFQIAVFVLWVVALYEIAVWIVTDAVHYIREMLDV